MNIRFATSALMLLALFTAPIFADDAAGKAADDTTDAAEQAAAEQADDAGLDKNPSAEDVQAFVSKNLSAIMEASSSDPDKAEALLEEFAKTVEGLEPEDEAVKAYVERLKSAVPQFKSRIASARKLLELVGKESMSLEVEDWANGDALTDANLKGKVVLLDFWAVWCGPCVRTFPHLREWNEKYADKGLVIIGLTRYYKRYDFDAEAGKLARAEEELSPEQEREMLVKFAEHHELTHRFAIQADRALSDYYAVSGIPHVVLIDREGKIRMVRVGSGEKNAKDLDEMIQTLIEG